MGYPIKYTTPFRPVIIIIIILERYTSKKFIAMLINIKDFDVNKFNILRLISFTKFNNISNNREFYLTLLKKEIIEITSSTNKTRSTRL